MIKAEEARKVSEEATESKQKQKWNMHDAVQLAWFTMWIKLKAKKGKRKMASIFIARTNVVNKLTEQGFKVWNHEYLGAIIRW